MTDRSAYVRPTITKLGTVHELTLANPFNKIGHATDAFSTVVPGLVGSITPPQ